MNSKNSSLLREQARSRLGMTARPVPCRPAPQVLGEPVNDEIMEPRSARPLPDTSSSAQKGAPSRQSSKSSSGITAVLMGAWMMFTDAMPGMFSPMTFFFHQRLVLWKAAVYATVPMVMAALFYLNVPGQVAAYPLSSLTGWGYLASLFVASQVVFCLFLGLCQGLGAAAEAFAERAKSRTQR